MHAIPIRLLAVAILAIAGCSNDDDNEDSGVAGDVFRLNTADGDTIDAASLDCIYRQDTGASDTLNLQLQYLESPNNVAFALYVEDAVPAVPFVASAGQQGRFVFEAFRGGTAYQEELSNAELEIQLDALPSPSTLSDGDVVPLRGTLQIVPFTLAEAASSGSADRETASQEAGPNADLALENSTIDINCEAVYQLAEVVNQ